MIFGKKDHLVGLDIGSKTIKVGEVESGKKGYFLKKFGTLEIPPGSIEEGLIKDPEAVAGAINEVFTLHNIKEKKVAISIGGNSVIVKTISVPAMSEEEFSETISYEAEQYIPFDINEVNLDFQILGVNEYNKEQMNVLLVAAKKDMVQEYVEVVEMARLIPSIIDVDAFALQNIYEATYNIEESNEEFVALIDIGASKTSLNILKGTASLFMRDVSFGCNQINSGIISYLGCSMDDAELIKFNKDQGKISPDDLNSIITSVVNDWCAEIRRALDFFYSTYPDDRIKKIILSGGGGNINEFRELLAVETDTKVSKIDAFNGFTFDDGRFDKTYLGEKALQAAICMGLAMRRVNDK